MADTQRTRADLLVLAATNVTGAVSAQDLRDVMVSIMEDEFAYVGDFWAQPHGQYVTEEDAKGWIAHSQQIEDANSFGDVLYMTTSATWTLLDMNEGSDIMHRVLGICLESGGAVASGRVLREGVFRQSDMMARTSTMIGRPIYLDSNASGQISVTGGNTLSDWRIGFVEYWDSAPSLTTGVSMGPGIPAIATAVRFRGWAVEESS